MADEHKIDRRVPTATRFGTINKVEIDSIVIRDGAILAVDAASGETHRLWRANRIPKVVADGIKACAERLRDRLESVTIQED